MVDYREPESDLAIPPGEALAEELEVRGMTQRDLAEAMGRSPQAVSAIVRGARAIDAKTAIELEQALGIAASFWLRLEAQYRLALARQEVA